MKKLFRRLLSFVAIAPLVAGGTAVAMTTDTDLPVDTEWEQAINLDTVEAYTDFALNNPTSEFIYEARARVCNDLLLIAAAKADKVVIVDAEEACSTPKFIPNSIMVI